MPVQTQEPRAGRLRTFATTVRALLPQGGSLPDAEFARRHRAMGWLLWANAIGMPVYSLAVGWGGLHSALHGASVAVLALVAVLPRFNRKQRSVAASVGLMTSAALLVHISGGVIEAHFYFFVLIVLLTLYEDWVPFLAAVGFVLFHHGVVGMLDPQAVFNRPEQFAQPWKWAAIHALFVAGGAIAGMITWRINEDVRAKLRAAQRESEAAAMTDSLTGLANRRALMADLAGAMSAARGGRPSLLMLCDLNGFKNYNDAFGHAAGDALLARLGNQLRERLGDAGACYRLGGDEFCVLAPLGAHHQLELEALASAALSERGEGFSISTSYGSALIPEEATSPEESLRVSDQRMYARKNGGRRSAGMQSRDVLLQALSERYPDLTAHMSDVAELAVEVSAAIGLSEAECEQVRQAAELHDVGKVAIPDAILNKPGPLDDAERGFVERHTIVGERIVAAAPSLAQVARLVRATHERFDGHGYPDALAGEEIPLGARIIFACDAFHAIISERPYAPARTPAEALAEVVRCAGSQFDPRVVGVLQTVCARREQLQRVAA
jgi:diguanylate cyclase (GGDEF)-like protein